MMEVTITCSECGSAVHVHPDATGDIAKCSICSHETNVKFNADHEKGNLLCCPLCERQDFYKQKDFNRKIGVTLFVLAAIASIWTYGISFIILYLFDLLLFKKLGSIVICYKCGTIFRKVGNLASISGFNHEMHDRIVYSDHDFKGEQLSH
ncbi:MAG: hypothetical protein HOE90_23660 [Bacteriovoracaceae bacterium]|jgi:hypothetical protein|nr:hypothetical protein [Bacteriovoracaceae bacterium]